jgi:hypothetical protein
MKELKNVKNQEVTKDILTGELSLGGASKEA